GVLAQRFNKRQLLAPLRREQEMIFKVFFLPPRKRAFYVILDQFIFEERQMFGKLRGKLLVIKESCLEPPPFVFRELTQQIASNQLFIFSFRNHFSYQISW